VVRIHIVTLIWEEELSHYTFELFLLMTAQFYMCTDFVIEA